VQSTKAIKIQVIYKLVFALQKLGTKVIKIPLALNAKACKQQSKTLDF